ncbi:hypothetical protein OESDEN_08466 [Oesophagostomum dentatum]|uniref:Uncharacterized protein n=1 Tax=Oesophagostomum dentatum TaxID=61180 RepID=A0A0B1T7B9_OESDE|nr:hypothetical protein OESDEN_08466 [Oesophagostomum dentatum]
MYEQKEHLCNDEMYTGFLLDKDALNWKQNIKAKDQTSVVHQYLLTTTMFRLRTFRQNNGRRKLKYSQEFRKKIGCSEEKINGTQEIAELFICNERCIQAGIGYIPSLIMLLSFSISFIKNCLI